MDCTAKSICLSPANASVSRGGGLIVRPFECGLLELAGVNAFTFLRVKTPRPTWPANPISPSIERGL